MAQKLGYFEEAGLDVDDPDALRPRGADQAGRRRAAPTWRSPTSPRWCWPTSKGLDVDRRRRARQPAADLDDLAAEVGDQGHRRPARQDDRHRRHPLPGRLPEDDPRPRQALPLRRARRSTSASACCRRSSAAAPRRCWAASATSRASTCACAARTRSSPRSTSSASPPTTSWCWSPSASALEEDPEAIRLFIAALARGTAAAVDKPGRGDRSAARGEPRPRPEADPGRGGGDAAAARAAPRRPALRLHGPRPRGASSSAGCATTN